MATNLDQLSAAAIARGVAAGDFSATEVARASLDAIEARDGEVQAFLQVASDLALSAAAATDAARAKGERLGPLAGVPVAFKDNMHLVGTRTTCASRMLADYESVFTSTCVQRMIDAGATPMGKANMDEFAFGSSTETSFFHRTNNPWDLERVPGGSSGGSAAAVAAGEVTISLGSDTGGSIRQPASLCGVVGLKPTYGAVSRYGVVAFGSSLDQVGPFARSVSDVALAMNALVGDGRDPLDCTSQDCPVDFLEHLEDPVEGMRVGVIPELMEADGLTDEVKVAVRGAREALESQGARTVEIELPHMGASIAAYYVIGPCEAFSNLARFDGVRYGYQEPGCSTLAEQSSRSRAHGFGDEAKRRQLLGAYLLSSGVYETYYYPAQQVRTLITQDYAEAYEQVRRHPHAHEPAHGVQVRRDLGPDPDVPLGHVHHLLEHRGQRCRIGAARPREGLRGSRSPPSSSGLPSRTAASSPSPAPSSAPRGRRPAVAPAFASRGGELS
jgi:aspartyl-tRNA(Asn)/glutamyl-tRNA(Gln) amidotransferase subunit A